MKDCLDYYGTKDYTIPFFRVEYIISDHMQSVTDHAAEIFFVGRTDTILLTGEAALDFVEQYRDWRRYQQRTAEISLIIRQ